MKEAFQQVQSEGFPLTSLQLGMIYESTVGEQPWVNVEQVVVELDAADASIPTLNDAWAAISQRHDALRLAFDIKTGGRPMQCVVDQTTPSVSAYEISDQPGDFEGFLEKDRVAGFDFAKGPPWRVSLIRFPDQTAKMIWTAHHAVVDGRSIAHVLRDLLGYVENGVLPPQSSVPSTYENFSRTLASGIPDRCAAETYFREYLAGFEDMGAPSMSTFERVDGKSQRKKQAERYLSAELTAQLERRALSAGSRMANLVQAAWALALTRWQGLDEATFGIVRTGRHAIHGTHDTVGCLINTLPMRVRLSRDLTFGDLLQKLRQDTLALYPFEQTPLPKIREWAGLSGQQNLFNSLVMYENADLQGIVNWHKDIPITLHEEGGLPLTLAVYGGERLRVMLEHDPAIIPDPVAARLIGHVETLLHRMADTADDALVGTLSMLPKDEHDALIALAAPDIPLRTIGDCLARRFDEVVRSNPNATALEIAGGDERLTYADLRDRVAALAATLTAQGISTGDVVAIGLPRSVDFIVSLLAILRTGAAFLPVDPTYPEATRAHMLSDSGARAIVAYDHDSVLLLIRPDQASAAPATPLPAIDPDARAYIIYTSGSTGKPKGVQVSRANLLSHIAAITDAFGLTADDRVLQFASLSFDVALEEVIPTLLNGATLILRSDEMAQSAGTFLDRCATLRPTIMNLPTAFWAILTDFMGHSGKQTPDSMRLIIVGGEQVKPQSLVAWQKLVPDVTWMNGYGPTETTITCTLHTAGQALPDEDIPIGRPTAHARAYVMAADGSLAPRGAPGELVIGGPAVSIGYINRPEETDKAFLPDPFVPGGRMYRSGDTAQWRPDGTLHFLGREDRQVKVRGYRIDLRQVEQAVEEAAPDLHVIAGVANKGTPAAQLVTWVSPENDSDAVDIDALTTDVAEVLPSHMQPTLVHVPEFPRTAGGKIDKAALPAPSAGEIGGSTDLRPTIGLEADICAIMAKVLGRDQVGPDQSFYDLGGHSLLSVELIGRLEAMSGSSIGLMDFQTNPTPSQLARLLKDGSSGPKHIIPIQPKGSKPPLLGIHILGTNEEYFRPLAAHLGDDQPMMGVSVGSLDENTPTGIVNTASRYCADINDHYPDGPIHLMAVSLGSYMAFELARQLKDIGREIGMLALFDAAGPGGRDEYRGLRRVFAMARRAHYMGPGFVQDVLRNRLYNWRNKINKKKISEAEAQGETKAPMTVFEFIASNEMAVNAYDAQPLDVPLTIFRAESQFYDTDAAIKSGLGWADVAKKGFEVIDVPGGHLSLLQEPHVPTLAREMAKVLDRYNKD
ncbi:amino acid adenylation domain-containing protein [Yoonia sp. 2307UL14-13]|uniref:amino acid adenylation domain-containing protein n=1 Tax=Yoonia sp. 2307UL14-13 TaxID=3126506 RepID=UPI0030A90FA5